jgi:transcription antitermination factor NusG
MRLRNLYEVQIKPGERRGFSLRLKKLEDLQLKVAEMQSTISNLKNTSVPDVLKKQMQDLIDAANIEKEKLYSGYDVSTTRPEVEGIPGNLLQLFKAFDKNASTIMTAYRQTGKFLYRGIKSDEDSLYGKPFDERRAKDSNSKLSDLLNKALSDQGFDARRDNTSFTSGSKGQASNYGTVYVIVPRDGFTFHYSKKIGDLVLDSNKLNLLVNNDLIRDLTNIVTSKWNEVKQYFPHRYPEDNFFVNYDYEQDLRGLQNAVAAGVLPQNLAKYNSLEDLIDSEKVIQNFQYDQTDLVGAVNSGHEVMVRGPYYAIRADKFEKHFKNYLDLTASGPLKTPPRVEKKKDSEIAKALAAQDDGFENGEYVKHRFEPIFGEIVNAFHTNDFVQVKNYNGELLVVKKSNLTIIKPDDLETFEPGDKVTLKTKNTDLAYMNGKNAKVVKADGISVTVSYGSYGDTLYIPVFLLDKNEKYDTENPEVGDSVKITGGEFSGEHGTIKYVGTYKGIDVDFGDGDVEPVSKGQYEVVNPKSVPAKDTTAKFEIEDYVRVADDGEKMSGLVGTVRNSGSLFSTIRIFGSVGVFPSQKVSNKRLNKISQEEFEKQKLEMGANIIVVSGKHRGKTGKISYFYSTGLLEVTPPDGSGYFEVSGKDVVLQHKYTGNLKIDKGATNPVGTIPKVGDTVMIKTGPKADETGTVEYVWSTGKSLEVKIGNDEYTFSINDVKVIPNNSTSKSDDDDLVDLVDVDFEPLDEPTPAKSSNKPKVKVGDTVKIIKGKHVGNMGKAGYIYSSGDMVEVEFADGSSETYNMSEIEPTKKSTSEKDFDINALPFMVGDEANATNPNVVKKQWEVAEIHPDHVVLQNKLTQTIFKSPMEKFYKANPEYDPANKSSKKSEFQTGDAVTVTAGSFKDFEGIVVSDDTPSSFDTYGNDYKAKPGDIKVRITIFGKVNVVPLPPASLKKSKESTTTSALPSSVNASANAESILEKAKKAGSITYSQIDNMFDGDTTSSAVEELFNMFEKMGISVVADEDMTDPTETPEEKKQRILEPSNKAELLELLKDSMVKPLMRNAINNKSISYTDQLYLVMAADEKYYSLLLPYLELKGVKIEKQYA